MKLLITGCARSGTTLMIHLMRYFYNCKVVIEDEQHPADYYNYNDKDHVIVIKKPYLTKDNIQYFSLDHLLSSGWKVIWMLRNGCDVITSKDRDGGYHVNTDRWVQTNAEMLNHALHPSLMIVRYESLVDDPSLQLDNIASFINQTYQDGYSEFYEGINKDNPMDVDMPVKPIYDDSVYRWQDTQEDYLHVVRQFENKQFYKLLTVFDYI